MTTSAYSTLLSRDGNCIQIGLTGPKLDGSFDQEFALFILFKRTGTILKKAFSFFAREPFKKKQKEANEVALAINLASPAISIDIGGGAILHRDTLPFKFLPIEGEVEPGHFFNFGLCSRCEQQRDPGQNPFHISLPKVQLDALGCSVSHEVGNHKEWAQ